MIGVLGGVVLGAAVNLVADHFRWKREDERLERDQVRTLDDHRRELCVELSTSTDELFSRAWSLIDHRTEGPKTWRADPYVQSLADKLEAVSASVNRSYNELRILGMGARLIEAADRLLAVHVEAVNAAFAEEPGEWDGDEQSEASNDFLEAAHDELGITRTFVRGRTAPPRLSVEDLGRR